MAVDARASRLLVYLTEDDRSDGRSTADVVLEQARRLGLAGATVWRGVEGFGASGHLRSDRFPDLARGMPLVVEVIDSPERIRQLAGIVDSLAPGVLMTTEAVQVGSDGADLVGPAHP